MSASWMLYATCVAVLLAVGATLFEFPLLRRNGSTRFLWVIMLVGALCWPFAIAFVGQHAIAAAEHRSVPASPASSDPIAAVADGAPLLAPPLPLPAVVSTSPDVDRIAQRLALLAPLLVVAILVLELVRLARARRRWHPGLIDGVPVLVSVDFGPAIVGVVRPQIVVPAWAFALPPEQRTLMIAHESEHLASHDNRWLGIAFLAMVLAPWNIGLWWLVNRFRLALEVDCDRRVLRRGYNLEQYGNLLIGIGRHDAGHSLLAAGFAERRTTLRARIDRMTGAAGAPSGTWRAVLGLALVVAACSLGPARNVQHHTVATAAVRTKTVDAVPAVSAVVPPSVRTLLDRLAAPTSGTPSVVTKFSRDTVDVGDPVELVTATWFPRRLHDALHHLPVISYPLLSGVSDTDGQQLPIAGGTRMETGAGVDLYVSWQTIPTSRSGTIEASPAVLTYGVASGPIFVPVSRIVVRSLPAVLVVRTRK